MQHLFATIIHPRHFWRRIKMTELSELYISMTLKSLALSLVAIFVPIYLYQEGFSIIEIFIYFAFYFGLRTGLDLVSGALTARFGPKHMLSYSYVLLVVFLGLLLTLPTFNWPLFLVAFANALFNSFFFVAYHVDFSKVHSIEKGGSELSLMTILVRAAAAAGPFVGGLIATVFSINATILLALVLVLFAVWPLMLTTEPVKTRRKMQLHTISFKKYARTLIAYSALGIARQVSLVAWPLYIAIFVFVDDVYAQVGFVTSIAIAASLIVTRVYGRLIDKHTGRTLFNTASGFSAIVHLLRPAISSLGGVTLVNMTAEFAETGALLPFTKGMYDEADSAKDRVAYVTVIESAIGLARGVFWFVLVIVAIRYGEEFAFITGFVIASACALLSTAQRFKALEPS